MHKSNKIQKVMTDDLGYSNATGCNHNSNSSEDITRYWTIKESVLKSLGIGLNVNLKDIDLSIDSIYSIY